MPLTFKQKFNKRHNQPLNQSNSLNKISKLSGIKRSSIQKIFNKGIGAAKTAGISRPNVKSPEQWAYGRVYASITRGSKSSKIDAKELREGRKKSK